MWSVYIYAASIDFTSLKSNFWFRICIPTVQGHCCTLCITTTLPPRSNGCNFAFNELQINFTLKKIWSGKIDAQSGSKLGKWAKIDSTSYRRWRSILTAEEVYKQKCRKISEGAQWTTLNQKNPGNLRSLTHRILGWYLSI